MADWMKKAAVAAHWLIVRVGTGLMLMLAAAAVVWLVLGLAGSLRAATTILVLIVAFLVGSVFMSLRKKDR